MVIFQFAMLNCQRVNINQSKPKVFLKVSTWQYDQTGYFFRAPYPSQLERKNSTAKRSILVVRMYHMDPYGLNFRAIFQAICPKFSQEYGFIYIFVLEVFVPPSKEPPKLLGQPRSTVPPKTSPSTRVSGPATTRCRRRWWLVRPWRCHKSCRTMTGWYGFWHGLSSNGGYTLTWPLNGLIFAKREGKSRETGI